MWSLPHDSSVKTYQAGTYAEPKAAASDFAYTQAEVHKTLSCCASILMHQSYRQ